MSSSSISTSTVTINESSSPANTWQFMLPPNIPPPPPQQIKATLCDEKNNQCQHYSKWGSVVTYNTNGAIFKLNDVTCTWNNNNVLPASPYTVNFSLHKNNQVSYCSLSRTMSGDITNTTMTM